MTKIRVIDQYATQTDIILKSQFICEIFPVYNEKEARQCLVEVKARHPKAAHHCYAYVLKNEYQNIENQSDDGEPTRTAGLPMLKILRYENLVNIIVIVTRYFGGTLLGTGGLVRAYAGVLKHTLAHAQIKEACLYFGYIIKIAYADNEELKHLIKKKQGLVTSVKYQDQVVVTCYLKNKEDIQVIKQNFKNDLSITIIETRYL